MQCLRSKSSFNW